MDKVKVLFLSANPVATPKLQLDEEIRQIGIKLRAAEYRDAFDFVPRFAARPDDLLQALLEHKPEIVHFSGHGSAAQQLIFVDDQGNEKPVTKEALVHLFRTLKDNIRLVRLECLLHASPGRGHRRDDRLHHRHEEAHRGRGGHRLRRVVLPCPGLWPLGEGGLRGGQSRTSAGKHPRRQDARVADSIGCRCLAIIFVQPPAAAAGKPTPPVNPAIR